MNEECSDEDGDKPRRGFWATVPPRTVTRVLILLALLAAVIFLQRRAGDIASCANRTFNQAPSNVTGTSTAGGGTLTPGHIRARVALPDASNR